MSQAFINTHFGTDLTVNVSVANTHYFVLKRKTNESGERLKG